jgi:hypothetical protein
MKKLTVSILPALLCINILSAQTNVRAWYAKGQVWIVWTTSQPHPETYEIYESDNAFASTANARLIGRLFKNEWKAGALRDQVNGTMKSINYRVPKGGSTYRLASDEGLFVQTPHSSGSKYYAVVKSGSTTVTPSNLTANKIAYNYDPINDPVQCHAQLDTTWPNAYKGRYYYMWADGRQDYWNSRPDFPVMANVYKNGMPSLFIISPGKEMDTTGGKKIPATLWLHGGSGSAIQSIPGSREQVNIIPKTGILVAHNDDFFRRDIDNNGNNIEDSFYTNTWFFGWAKNENPFDNIYSALSGDTIINYTQRRLRWINDWLIKNYNVDLGRISVNGHSMGSAGATALMKAYPEQFATATIFNNGLAGPGTTDQGYHLFGDRTLNLPTNLIRRGSTNKVVHIYEVFNLNDRSSAQRDLPLVRMYHGKNDDNGVMMWDAYVVQEYRKADSLGWGMQLYWSERKHGLETCWDHYDHWSKDSDDTRQTFRDNVSYEETYRSDVSYPAFFNHRLDNKNHDPGDGTRGTDADSTTDSSDIGVGHDWGTWGGYHEWNKNTIIDKPGRWRVTAWLIGNALYNADISPNDSLTANVSIRRPQRFKPATGTPLNWYVIDTLTLDTLQSGIDTVKSDSLVVIRGVKVYKETLHKVYIAIITAATLQTLAAEKTTAQQTADSKRWKNNTPVSVSLEQNSPNPCISTTSLHYHIPPGTGKAYLLITDNIGRRIQQIFLSEGTSTININTSSLVNGVYHYTLVVNGKWISSRKMIVAR